MRQAAQQGAALEQLGRYYDVGQLVQDKAMAVTYLREASAQGNSKAQMRLVNLFNQGYGSPRDYEDATVGYFIQWLPIKPPIKK